MNRSVDVGRAVGPVRPGGRRFAAAALAAGLLCNVSGILLGVTFLHHDAEIAFSRLTHRPTPFALFLQHVSIRLVLGVLVTWLVVALWDRYSRPYRAALAAAVFLWLSAYAFAGVILHELEIYSTATTLIALVWGFAELWVMSACVTWILGRRVSLAPS